MNKLIKEAGWCEKHGVEHAWVDDNKMIMTMPPKRETAKI